MRFDSRVISLYTVTDLETLVQQIDNRLVALRAVGFARDDINFTAMSSLQEQRTELIDELLRRGVTVHSAQ